MEHTRLLATPRAFFELAVNRTCALAPNECVFGIGSIQYTMYGVSALP